MSKVFSSDETYIISQIHGLESDTLCCQQSINKQKKRIEEMEGIIRSEKTTLKMYVDSLEEKETELAVKRERLRELLKIPTIIVEKAKNLAVNDYDSLESRSEGATNAKKSECNAG